MNIHDLLQRLPAALKQDAVDGIAGVVQLNISTPTYLSLSEGKLVIQEGTTEAPDVEVTLSDEDLALLLTGKLAAITAFMSGRLQVDGDLMLAKQLTEFFDAEKLV